MKNLTLLSILFILLTSLLGCKKYLEEKPDAKLDVPTTLDDFQALLDYYPYINNSDPSASEVSADNYYLMDADYNAITAINYRRMYTWEKSDLFVVNTNDWTTAYRPVYTANTVLEGLEKIAINPSNQQIFNNVKGQALYARGKEFLKIAGVWTSAYNDATASSQLGIPLRLSSDFNIPSVRSTLKDTYSRIITDLTTAAALLPNKPIQVLRPSKPAAFGLLSRAYLFMGDYIKAGLYADSALQIYSTLIDFNTLNAASAYPISKFNAEVIQESLIAAVAPLNNARCRIDTNLYNSYAAKDLRKTIFFKSGAGGTHVFKGSYEGAVTLFGGVATDELFLTRAECFARNGNIQNALSDLNALLIKRFAKGSFVPLTAVSSNDALNLVLTERRKELLMRGLRWDDLKRLNRDGANILLTRKVLGTTYNLQPNDLRYALPIPEDIIQLTGMPQNPR